MKKKNIFLIIMAISLLSFSCKREKEQEQVIQEYVPLDQMQEENILGMQRGFALRVNSGFYSLETDTGDASDKTRWAAGMALGERIFLGETRRLTFHGDNRQYDFIEVRRENGSEGYAFASWVAPAGSLAVVVDDRAGLFRTARSIDVSGVILSRRTVVVYYPETADDGFVKVRAFDTGRQEYVLDNNSFVRFSALSVRNSDIQAAILLQTALPLRNEGQDKIRRDALLEAALYDFPDSVFNAEINELLNPGAASEPVITIRYDNLTPMIITHNNVNVRDNPGITNSRVIGSFNMGDSVYVFEQTQDRFTVNGMNNYWYKVESNEISGWVFGEYLENLVQ